MELCKIDKEMLDTLERLATSSEYSTVLGVLQKASGNKLSRETVVDIVRNLSSQDGGRWSAETVERILDDLQALGWVQIVTTEIVRLIPKEEREKKQG